MISQDGMRNNAQSCYPLRQPDNLKRKLAWTWELVGMILVEMIFGGLVGIHAGRANGLVREALWAHLTPEFITLERPLPVEL